MGQPLDVYSQDMRSNHYSVVIYWRQRTGIDSLQNGHAALIIDSSAFHRGSPSYYVSWVGTGTSRALGTIIDIERSISYVDDARCYGGSRGDLIGNVQQYNPTRWVVLKHLHIGNMWTAWDQMRRKEGAHWKLIDKNCATAVSRILKAGGGDDFATEQKKQLVWWPTDVIKYAKSMGSNVVQTSSD